jgi:hypothetical protein
VQTAALLVQRGSIRGAQSTPAEPLRTSRFIYSCRKLCGLRFRVTFCVPADTIMRTDSALTTQVYGTIIVRGLRPAHNPNTLVCFSE